jgi:hypothetical protein
VYDIIAQAIRERRILELTYNNAVRRVEPYLIYESPRGDLILHSRQLGCEWNQSAPPDWCDMRIESICDALLFPDRYESPHPDYNPYSDRFDRRIIWTPPSRAAVVD